MVIAGPNSEGLVNPLRPLVATFSPVFHDHTEPLLPAGQPGQADRGQLPERRADLRVSVSRGRDRQLQFTYQVSAGNQTVLEAHDYVDWVLDAGGADIFMCYLEGIRDPARFRAVADKAARAGKPMIVAKVGRSDAGRRAAASHTGALAHAGAADDAIFRHHGIIRGEDLDHMVDVATAFAYLQAAARQPGRDHHRLGRQRGVDGRHPVGARARIAGARGGHPAPAHGAAAVLRLGAEPDRRDGAGDRRGRLRADGRAGARSPKRIDTILLISSLANESTREEAAPTSWRAITATLDKPILMSTYTTATPAAIAAFAERRHPLLHVDAELRPRDPRAGRLRRVPRAAGPPRRRDRRRRRCAATRSRARCRCPARC